MTFEQFSESTAATSPLVTTNGEPIMLDGNAATTTNTGETQTTTIEQGSDADLNQRYETVKKELLQVGGVDTSDDNIEIADGLLDGKFAEYLLKNPESLNALKGFVNTIKNNGLKDKAGNDLKKLEDFLNNIGDNEKMEKDFKKFMDKLQKPKDLHKVKEKELNAITMHLSMNQNDAMLTYKSMKAILDNHQNFFGTGMKLDDINVFQTVWNSLKNNYQNNETFIETEYPGYSALSGSAISIQSFLMANKGVISGPGLEWEGDEITVAHLENKPNSIISRDAIVAKLNELNNQRIANNKNLILAVDINIPPDGFTRTADGGGLKFKGTDFSANDVMMYSDQIAAAINGGDFVNDNERWRTINDCRNELYEKFKAKLLADPSIPQEGSTTNPEQNTNNPDQANPNPEQNTNNPDNNNPDQNNETGGENTKLDANDRLESSVKNKLVELGIFENAESHTVKIAALKSFIDTIKDKSWSELQGQKRVDRRAWIASVQIALNFLGSKNEKEEYKVTTITGKRLKQTKRAVKAFQKDNDLAVDGAPGPKTLSKILEALGGVTSSAESATNQPNEKVFDYDSITSLNDEKVQEILKDRQDYDETEEGKNDTNVRVLKLNELTSLTEENATALSAWKGNIQVNKLLSDAAGENGEQTITVLSKLAPKGGDKAIIETSDKDTFDKLQDKGFELKLVEAEKPSDTRRVVVPGELSDPTTTPTPENGTETPPAETGTETTPTENPTETTNETSVQTTTTVTNNNNTIIEGDNNGKVIQTNVNESDTPESSVAVGEGEIRD